MTYFDTHPTGKRTARLFSDVGMIQGSSGELISALVAAGIALSVNAGVMFYLNWKLALLSIAFLPLYGVTCVGFATAIRRCTESIRERNSKLWARSHERLAGVQIVKCFSQEARERLRFFRLAREQYRELVRRGAFRSVMTTLCALIYYGGFATVVWLGIYMLKDGWWTAGEFLWFNSLCLLSYPPFSQVVGMATPWKELRTNLRRVFEILDEHVTIEDSPRAIALEHVKGEVQFLDVSLLYPNQPTTSLEKINLKIPPGTKVSLMGPSGAGKTSLTRLLQRLYDPTEGCILLDGHNLTDINLRSLREKIVRVPQETIIFSGTFAENIRYGHIEATNQQVIEAAQAAELHDFIMGLPEKYETELGEMGLNLSGGQKQRLAIARALVTDPGILILDDTTSALDAETAARIEETLARILKDRTAFIITHRLATAMYSDIIIVMEDGRITETGRHWDLLKNEGLYYRMYKQQTEK
jgi:ABC-type multidrug transport system fused ATPase/permease subunit